GGHGEQAVRAQGGDHRARAPAAGVPGGGRRLVGAGEFGEFVGVRLEDAGASGDAAAQRRPAGGERGGHPGGAGGAQEPRVGAHRDARGEAAAQGHRGGGGQECRVGLLEGGPLGGGDGRAGFVELGGAAGAVVDHGYGAPGRAVDRDQFVHQAAHVGELLAQD